MTEIDKNLKVDPAVGPAVGDLAPDFSVIDDRGETVQLSDCKGRFVILYFYPKDDTPGCTLEACEFRDAQDELAELNALVMGVSKDSKNSHQKFSAKYQLTFPLLVDETGEICEKYGVWKQKSFMGKSYMGIDRSTFLIDPQGVVVALWRSVKVKGHKEAVKEALKRASL